MAARAVWCGAGGLRALRTGARGTVLASLSRACYLDLPGGIIALVGPDVHRGPVHVVLDAAVPRVSGGSPVRVEDRELLVGWSSVDLRGMQVWSGVLPPQKRMRTAAALVCGVLEPVAAASALPALGDRASRGLGLLEAGNLAGAAHLLCGLGPGLTPAGDDALAGAMLGLRALSSPRVGAMLARTAAAFPTARISLAFLRWAARGQALAPVHDLFAAAARGEAAKALTAARALGGIGATSGADFACGLMAVLMAVPSDCAPSSNPPDRRLEPCDHGVCNRHGDNSGL